MFGALMYFIRQMTCPVAPVLSDLWTSGECSICLPLALALLLVMTAAWLVWALADRRRIRRTTEDLRRSENNFRLMADYAPGVVYLARNDPRWTMLYVNSAALLVTGYPTEDFLANKVSFADIIHPDDKARVYQEIQAAITLRQSFYLVYRITRRDKQVRWVEERGIAICCKDGLLDRLAGHIVDITQMRMAEEDRQGLERSALQAQKLESLGVLAGGIAHDFNNLLMVMMGNLEMALDDIPEGAESRRFLQRAEQAARHAALLTRQMLSYAGKNRVAFQRVDLNAIIEEMDHLLRSAIPKNVEISKELRRPLPMISADPAQLQQVVMNLMTNAAESIGDKPGAVRLSTGIQDCSCEYLAQSRLEPVPPPGAYVFFMLADTGCGMSKATQRRVFEPFFSTKFAGRGLGMASLMGVVKAHGGAIIMHSDEGQGATFKILFPATESKTADEAQMDQGDKGALSFNFSGAVLVADDEPSVRNTLKLMLERLGFMVLTASDGKEAVEIFRKRSNEITLTLLDLTMPRMDGAAAFAEIMAIKPDAIVLLSSGYAQQSVMERFTGAAPAGFIEKPYQLKRLCKELRRALAARGSGKGLIRSG